VGWQAANGLDQYDGNFSALLLGEEDQTRGGIYQRVTVRFQPWIIAVSRNVREYAVVPLFFYLDALVLIDLLDWDGLA